MIRFIFLGQLDDREVKTYQGKLLMILSTFRKILLYYYYYYYYLIYNYY